MNQIKCSIPLTDVKLNLDICNNICQFTFDQTYFNSESNPIEVNYVFPSICGTSVYDFRAVFDDTTIIETQLKPKDIAIQEYNQAVSDGKRSIFMEQFDSDIFAICLGTIPAQSGVKIRIRCVTELQTEIDSTQLRLNVPLTIMPKYTPLRFETGTPTNFESHLVRALDSTPKIQTKPYDFELRGQIYMSDSIKSFDSKTHRIKLFDMSSHELKFEIRPEALDQDIILSIVRGISESHIVSEIADFDLPSNGSIYKSASQITIRPDYSKVAEPVASDLTYVLILDRSGSMQGADFDNCIKAAKLFVLDLPFGSKFNIYEFGDDYTKFDQDMVCCTAESKQSAINWLNTLKCFGGTEVLPVMTDIYKTLKQTPGTIIFLSDGGVSNTDQIIKLVKSNPHTKIYTIGIGRSVSQHLIQSMATQSGAIAEFINSADDQLREKVLAQVRRSQQSMHKCQSNNKIKIDTDGLYKIVLEPTHFHEFDLNTFYIFSENPIRSVTYEQFGAGPDFVLRHTQTLYASQVTLPGSMIHRIAGTKLIEEIMNKPIVIGSQIPRLQCDLTTQSIIQISQCLGILSAHTAFIGVGVEKILNDGTQIPVLKYIPLQQPAKYSSGGLTRLVGIHTVGSSLRNGTYDPTGPIPNPKINKSPWSKPTYQDCCRTTMKENTIIHPRPLNMQSLTYKDCSVDTMFDHYGIVPKNSTQLGMTQDNSYNINHYRRSEKLFDDCTGSNKIDSIMIDCCLTTHKENTIANPIFNPNTIIKPKPIVSFVVKTNLTNYMIIDTIVTSATNAVLEFASEVAIGDYIELTTKSNLDGVYKIISLGSAHSPWVLERIAI